MAFVLFVQLFQSNIKAEYQGPKKNQLGDSWTLT